MAMEGSSSKPARWIVVGQGDRVSRLLLERLGERARFIPDSSSLDDLAALLESPATEAVVYRPPLHSDRADRPDLAAAEVFFQAFARALKAPVRLVLLSSAAAIDPSHHNIGYLTEEHRSPGRNPIAR